MTSENMQDGRTGGPTGGNTFAYTFRLWGPTPDQVEDVDTDDPALLAAALRTVADRYDPPATVDNVLWAAGKAQERRDLTEPWREVVRALTDALSGLAGGSGATAPSTVDPPEVPRTGFAANLPHGAEPAGPGPDVLGGFLRGGWPFDAEALRTQVRHLCDDRDRWRGLAEVRAARPTGDTPGDTQVWRAGYTAGVRWAAAEADEQARGHCNLTGDMLDITDHLRLCAADPGRETAVGRPWSGRGTAPVPPTGDTADPPDEAYLGDVAVVTADTVPPEIMEYVNLRAGREHRPGGRVATTVAGVINRWERVRPDGQPSMAYLTLESIRKLLTDNDCMTTDGNVLLAVRALIRRVRIAER